MQSVKILSILLLSLSVSACTGGEIAAAAVVAGGALGYYVHNDPRSAKQIAIDTAISAEINKSLQATANVNTLTVKIATYNQIVTLSGSVYSANIVQIVESIAANTRGVAGIHNKLEVISPYGQ